MQAARAEVYPVFDQSECALWTVNTEPKGPGDNSWLVEGPANMCVETLGQPGVCVKEQEDGAAGGLVAAPVGGHGERAALTNVQNEGLNLYMVAANQAVLYVELHPCVDCTNWLNGGAGGGGVLANPFFGVINGAGPVTLNVWYRWAYPGPPALPPIGAAAALATTGAVAMNAFHALALPAELADINGASW